MPLKIIYGNIFTSSAQTLVNSINCAGVMGAGIALECRLRYPDMYERYVELCKENKIQTGQLWLYRSSSPWILNFPTKRDWKRPSSADYLRSGLAKFQKTYKSKGIESIAFPLLGADKGGIDSQISLGIMKEYLENLDLKIEIYRHDQKASDDLYNKLKIWMSSNDEDYISLVTGVRKTYIRKVMESLHNKNICQLNQLSNVKGIGISTLEKLFKFAMDDDQTYVYKSPSAQQKLF